MPMLLTRVLPITCVLGLMALSLTLVENFARFWLILPFSLIFAGIVARMWLDVPYRKLDEMWDRFTRHWVYPWSLIIASLWTLFLLLLPVIVVGHFPRPNVHDEFSFLLGAETYLAGRLTNPSPACPEHFESFHITVTPSYQTKYQPGMSLMLALGLLLGHAYVGMIVAMLLGSIGLTWMLHHWLPQRWALPMVLLGILVMVDTWRSGYFVSGPMAVFAGAIQLGLFRCWCQRDIHWLQGLLWGISLVMLAWTRPFEGLLFSVMIGMAALVMTVQQRTFVHWLIKILPGLLFILVPAGWFQTEYNMALTGSRTRFPYFIHDQQYFIAPPFLFQPPFPEPEYRHDIIRRFHQHMAEQHRDMLKPENLLRVISFRFGIAWVYLGQLLWLLPMMVLPELWKQRATRWLLLLWFSFLFIIQVVSWFLSHYAAPAFPAWLLLISFAIRYVRLWEWKVMPVGRFLVCFFVMNSVGSFAVQQLVLPLMLKPGWSKTREDITWELLTQGPRHLVLVEYGTQHSTGEEWVYNGANLESQPIVWARSMSREQNAKLIASYPGRITWLLKADSTNPRKPVEFSRYEP
jgi:hypothetical protein